MKAIYMAAARARTREREVRQIEAHNERMHKCCIRCRDAPLGRVCPDCYLCLDCGEGCDECGPLRDRT